MKKRLLFLFLLLSLVTIACVAQAAQEENTENMVATQVAATVAAIGEVATDLPAPTETSIPSTTPAGPTETGLETYVDQDLEFQISYDPSWVFEIEDGTGLTFFDGAGKSLAFRKEGYFLFITVVDGVDEPLCGGLLGEGFDLGNYHIFNIDGVEIWRIKAENGLVNGFNMSDMAFLEIMTPEILYDEPDEDGYEGIYNCRYVISDHLVEIDYQLPLSLEMIEAGKVDAQLLGEMDQIMTSLTWQQ